MGQYLLKRRLRHVRSVKISNLCVGQRNSQQLMWFPSYFIVIENGKGQTLYVSEVQQGSLYSVQFNELPPQDSPLTHFTLRLVAELPERLSPSPDEKLWFDFRTYKVDLNQVKHVSADDIIESYNAPVLELVDGDYVLPNVSMLTVPKESIRTHKRANSSIKIKKSFTFNYALKLNKILEYTSQVMEESQQISERVERQIQDEHKRHQWFVTHLRDYNHQLKVRIQKKQLDLRRLRDSVEHFAESEEKDSQPHSLNDYYGNTYPNLIQSRNRLESMRAKKLAQLIGIFQTTDLFHVRAGFVTFNRTLLDSSSSLYDRLTLDLLNKTKLLELATDGSEASKKLTSTCLGYYTLFVTLIATSICSIPLPHELMYCGSTSTPGH
ncbi:hypothetical protein LQ764DRAFT_227463 [Zygosaccharomyces rouxii]|nr:hypothetical protein LQ764DRAFT_227463 [Zygosaccharomyces rouxii]